MLTQTSDHASVHISPPGAGPQTAKRLTWEEGAAAGEWGAGQGSAGIPRGSKDIPPGPCPRPVLGRDYSMIPTRRPPAQIPPGHRQTQGRRVRVCPATWSLQLCLEPGPQPHVTRVVASPWTAPFEGSPCWFLWALAPRLPGAHGTPVLLKRQAYSVRA